MHVLVENLNDLGPVVLIEVCELVSDGGEDEKRIAPFGNVA
jgi:hypothetical protein